MLRFARFVLVAAALSVVSGIAFAQPVKLKWAHVYETSEPYHKWLVWAAGEIEKRTNGKYHVDVFPASSLGKESDINQGLTLGTVDVIISGLSFAARRYEPSFVCSMRSHVPRQVAREKTTTHKRYHGMNMKPRLMPPGSGEA